MVARPAHNANTSPREPQDHLPKQAPSSEVSQWMRANAHKSWGNTTDRTKRTANARAGFQQKFLEQTKTPECPEGDPVRAESLRRSFYAGLAAKSAAARRRNREDRENGAA